MADAREAKDLERLWRKRRSSLRQNTTLWASWIWTVLLFVGALVKISWPALSVFAIFGYLVIIVVTFGWSSKGERLQTEAEKLLDSCIELAAEDTDEGNKQRRELLKFVLNRRNRQQVGIYLVHRHTVCLQWPRWEAEPWFNYLFWVPSRKKEAAAYLRIVEELAENDESKQILCKLCLSRWPDTAGTKDHMAITEKALYLLDAHGTEEVRSCVTKLAGDWENEPDELIETAVLLTTKVQVASTAKTISTSSDSV